GQDVTPLETGFGGGRVLPYVAELDADGAFGEIGDAAEVGAVAGGLAGGHIAGVRRERGQLDESGTLRRIAQALGYLGDQGQQFGGGGCVDLVPGVRGLVIVGVQAGEEKQRGDLVRGERGVVA